MWNREWTLFLVSKDTGKEMPHWVACTRKRCREELRSLKAQCGGKLPKSIKAVIRKTKDIFEDEAYDFAARPMPSPGLVGGTLSAVPLYD